RDVGLRVAAGTPQVRHDRVAGHAAERGLADETRGGRRHRDAHLASRLRERRGEVDELVRRDAARDEHRHANAAQLRRDRRPVERHQRALARTEWMMSSTSPTARSRTSLTTTWS